jgi:hypothetical protein
MIDQFRGKYRWLSNFHECKIDHLGLIYPTTEHAYQAAKRWDDEEFHRHIQSLKTPREAMIYGRSLPITTPHWHELTKFNVMWDVNFYKFSEHSDLKEKLLATGDEELVEGNTWGDTCWGICNGKGDNHLGKTLMMIRNQLRLLEGL